MRIKCIFTALAMMMTAGAGAALAAPIELQFWHPSLGPLDDAVQKQIRAFNDSQPDYKVAPIGKGTYDETLNAGIAAYRAGKPPQMMIVIGQGTQTMLLSNAIYPVHDLMADQGHKVAWERYIQPVLNYYRSPEGKLLSLPFSVSTPILWYNKDAFGKAGLTRPPETWDELGQYAAKLRGAGFECGYASGWQQWVHIDNYAVMHDTPVATRQNGLQGLDAEFVYNKGPVSAHLARVQGWAKDGRYVYAGRGGSNATGMMIGLRCPMITHSSAIFSALVSGAKFEFAAAAMPHETGVAPKNSLIGGGTIWVMKGHKPEEYKGVAAFMAHLSGPEAQATWHQDTGYVPLTVDAYEKVKASGYYEKYPQQEVAIKQLLRGTPTDNTKTVRLGSAAQYVAVIEEELEAIWSDKKPAQQAVDDAVRRGNEILRRFERQRGN